MLYQLPLVSRYNDLPEEQLREGIIGFKRKLGRRLVILGHHYQQDDVFQFADFTGDSLKLSQLAAKQRDAEFIVFCGVHFMAESADILTSDRQTVILPDLSAGCSMADMAHIDDLEAAWPLLEQQTGAPMVPITYVNSSAAVKAFVGRHGGACCTSSNAQQVLEWALDGTTPSAAAREGRNVLFLPDQHLGRNSAYALGWSLESMAVYDPKQPDGGMSADSLRDARFFLWKGHCSVHQLFTPAQADAIRALEDPYTILCHPECSWDVCRKADLLGSTEFIIRTVRDAPSGSYWAIGTEVHLIQRLAAEHPDKHIRSLAGIQCLCTTMYRVDLKHLYWTLEQLCEGNIVNPIRVDPETKRDAITALDRMLELTSPQPVGVQ
jgi:quinolinate synthase